MTESAEHDHPEDASRAQLAERPETEFHPWRLLGVIGLVLLALAGVAALVDVLVLGW